MKIFRTNSFFEHWRQIAAISIAGMSMFNYGLLFGWPSSAIVKLIEKNHPLEFTYDEASYLTVIPPISTIITSLPVGWIINRMGRRYTLLLGSIPYCVSWILIIIGGSKWSFYASRFITGIGDSCTICASSLYAGEISVPEVRGRWGNLLVVFLQSGILMSYILGGNLSMEMTAYSCLGIPLIQFILLCGIPESPYFLIMKNRTEDAKTSLQWLRQSKDVDSEFKDITSAVERQMQEPGTYKDILFIKSHRKAMIAVVIARLVHQFSGIAAFLVYAQTIFEMAGGNLTSNISAMICGSIQLVFTLVGLKIVDKWGRRKAFFNSAIGAVIILLLLAIYFYLESNTDIDLTSWLWFPLAGMILFLIVFSLGLTVVPTLLSAELFSSSIKEKSMSINNIIFAALIAGTSKIFQVLSKFGLYAPFAFYGFTCLVLTIMSYFIIPETQGKTLDEIQLELQGKKRPSDNNPT